MASSHSDSEVITASEAQTLAKRDMVSDISPEFQAVLQSIVDDVVKTLGCVGAMVAPLEAGNALPVRAYAIDLDAELLEKLQEKLGVSIIGPQSIAYLDDKRFEDNLSVRAIKNGDGSGVTLSDSLYDLFRPVVKRSLADAAQQMTGIRQVAAVPFFLNDEVVGNLFVAARQAFSPRDIDFLAAFGRQAAIAIQSQNRLARIQALERVILTLQSNITDETQIMQTIVDAVVHKLGYAGAMVAPLEEDDSLPVRAYAVDLALPVMEQLEKRIGVSMIGPKSVAYLNDERFKDNLSVRAVKGENGPPGLVMSDSLYDLFRPVVNQTLSDVAQRLTGIKKVLAIPFFLEDKVVGNLFVATRKPAFSKSEIEILMTFGQQAAVGIHNARLYNRAEEQQRIAQLFSKMAFGATALIHTLRNHVGVTLNFLQLLEMVQNLDSKRQNQLLESTPDIIEHLNQAVSALDNLHTPWRQSEVVLTDVNSCLARALGKVFPDAVLDSEEPEIENELGIVAHRLLSPTLPQIRTVPDMLTEAFRIIIKNGIETIGAKDEDGGDLWVESYLRGSIIQIVIRDSGEGIRPENLKNIFEMGWSTKEGQGMGFGLFWAKDYIDGLGGTITVESVWQKGTTFYINIPVSAGEAR